MNVKQAVSNYIGQLKGLTLSKGHQLKSSGNITDVTKLDEGRILAGKVKDGDETYNISLYYDEDLRKYISDCSCPDKMDCAHSAALALYIVENLNNITDANPEADYNKFFSTECNEFRIIQKNNEQSWFDFIEALKPKNRMYNTRYDIGGYIRDDNHAIVQIELPYGPNYERYKTIDVEIVDEQFAIKCEDCTEKTNRLCEHQYHAIQFLIGHPKMYKWVTEEVSYENIIDFYIEEFQLTKEELEENFKVTITANDVQIDPKLGVFYDKNLDTRLNKSAELSKIEEDKEAIEKLPDFNQIGQAIVWFQKGDEKYEKGYHFVQGKLNKSRSKLINSFHTIDFPGMFPQEFQEMVIGLEQFYRSGRFISKTYQNKILAYLQLNRGVLQDVPQILYVGDSFPKIDHIDPSFDEVINPSRKINKKEIHHLKFRKETCRYVIRMQVFKTFWILKMVCIIDDKIVEVKADYLTSYFTVFGHKAYIHEHIISPNHKYLASAFHKVYVKTKDFSKATDLLLRLQQFYEVIWDEQAPIEFVQLEHGQKELYIEEHGNYITMEAYIKYEKVNFNILESDEKRVSNVIYQINREERFSYIEYLATLHPNLKAENANYLAFDLTYQDLLEGMWFLEFFERCKDNNIAVYGQDNLKNLKFNNSVPSISSFLKSGQNWFEVDVDMKFGDLSVSAKEWVDSIRNRSKYIKLSDGTIGIIPTQWYEKLRNIYEISHEKKSELQINAFNFNEIEQIFEADEIDNSELFQELKEKKERLENFDQEDTYALPKMIKAELRPYQLTGYQWLKFLDDFRMGGILADEMGLGKTIQVITLLAHFKEELHDIQPNLVIVPRSLMFNWVEEIKKFAPKLNVLVHHGTNRDMAASNFGEFDVIITTYDTAVQDRRVLKKLEFHYIILDESQAIKNPSTKRFQAVTSFQAKNRLAMTGTPIENNTFDLYAQFTFVNPGIFGSITHFKNTFSLPIDVKDDSRMAEKLQRITAPYLLRRTKNKVAADLPSKTESIIYCDMLPAQRQMYDQLKQAITEDLTASINSEKSGKTTFLAIEGLLRLRQICNSPRLVDKTLPPFKQESAKLNTLVEILSTGIGDSSALVFSQFTSMLALIREKLDALGIKYAYLDGSTKDRQAVVNQFQNDPNLKIFLISLKAGNTGLNLTKAEYVYIVDPWWNPAVESQAIDRTHRIGQDKHIIAYRMICKDTIEEKINALQQRKKKVASDIIHSEQDLYKSLDKKELLELFNI